MTEKSQWYYVENQERKGPVSISTIKKLVGQGVITEQTLVWKEGMQDWEPASKIKGLFEKKPEPLPKVKASGSSSRKSRSNKPTVTPVSGDTSEPSGATADPPGASPRPTPVPQPVDSPTEAPSDSAPGPVSGEFSIQASDPAASRSRLASPRNLMQQFQFLGYPCLVIGFLLVIGSKGCDSLGNRWASRLSANSRIAEEKFNYSYERKRNSYQSQIDAINESDNPDASLVNDLRKRISDLNREQSKERQKLTNTTWFELNASAKMAQANNQAWGFFRELGFVFGSMVLSIGLLVLGITGNASEKWTCLIMLAIITFSIYIGGFAWFSSIAGNVPGGMGF